MMDSETFIHLIENYYGTYRKEAVKEMVEECLKEYDQKKLDELYRLILRNHSSRFGAPGVAEISTAYERARAKGECGQLRKEFKYARMATQSELAITEEEYREGLLVIKRYGGHLMNRVKMRANLAKAYKKGREKEAS